MSVDDKKMSVDVLWIVYPYISYYQNLSMGEVKKKPSKINVSELTSIYFLYLLIHISNVMIINSST